jgi:hypothetical protein
VEGKLRDGKRKTPVEKKKSGNGFPYTYSFIHVHSQCDFHAEGKTFFKFLVPSYSGSL